MQITNHFDGSVLFEDQSSGMTQRELLEKAVGNGADLYGANLRGADLYGANLRGADLYGANLRGAEIEKGTLIGNRSFFSIQNIGSRSDTLMLFITDNGAFVKTGCFFDTIIKFKDAVEETHGDSIHAKEYEAAIVLLEMHVKLWTPE